METGLAHAAGRFANGFNLGETGVSFRQSSERISSGVWSNFHFFLSLSHDQDQVLELFEIRF